MFGKKPTEKQIEIAQRIAGYTNNETIAPSARLKEEDFYNLKPIRAEDGYEIYAVQWGDVTILAWYRNENDIIVKAVFW